MSWLQSAAVRSVPHISRPSSKVVCAIVRTKAAQDFRRVPMLDDCNVYHPCAESANRAINGQY